MSVETIAFDREKCGVVFGFAAVDDDGADDDVRILNDFAVRHLR
jgi:hypothetical protein